MGPHIQVLVGLVSISVFSALLSRHLKPNSKHIPAVGGSDWISSFITAVKFTIRGRQVLERGYRQYPSSLFKIPQITGGWQIVVTSPEYLNDIRRATEEELSIMEAQNDTLALEYTVGWQRGSETGEHGKALYRMLTKNYIPLCLDLYDEAIDALNSVICLDGDNWTSVQAYSMALNVIARVNNRLFVGLPLCRDPKYIKLVIDYSRNVPPSGMTITSFPKWMHRFIAYSISPLPKNTRRANEILGPYLEERLRLAEEHGNNWEDKPNDMITWLLDEAEQPQMELSGVVGQLLGVNFAGLISSSMTFTHALYCLTAHQEYIPILRQEVETITAREGWTKTAVGKMLKLDSFLRETTRLSGVFGLTLHRKVMNPSGFTFSDGTTLPYGAHVAVSAHAIHRQADLLDNPDKFDGLRFYNIRDPEDDDDEIAKEQITIPTATNLTFGLGKHVCPGRFFIIHNMKVIMAHIIMTYDIKFAEGVRPPDYWFKGNCVPSSEAKIMFRKRQN